MNKQYLAVSLIVVGAACYLGRAHAEDEIISAKGRFPEVKLACIAFQLPVDAAEATRVVDIEARNWYRVARGTALKRSGSPFVNATITAPKAGDADTPNTPMGAGMCAVVEQSVTSVAGMRLETMPAADGFAGFCVGLKVEACLQKAFKESGFTEAKPWPRLPNYARWPDQQAAPLDAPSIIAFLAAATRDIPPDMAGEGTTYERSTDGLKPLVPCAATGCPKQVANPPEPSQRIGWFIQALPPAAPVPGDAAQPAR